MKETEFLELIKEEWGKLVPAARYAAIYGLVFLILLWLNELLDLGFSESWKRALLFGGVSLAFVPLLFSLIERFWVNLRIVRYRRRYPIKDLNKKFYIISFNRGRVCLLDIVKKEIHWIKTWQTALDLDFIGEWTNIVDVDVTMPSTLKTTSFKTKDGVEINLRDFSHGEGIHTQGAPGT